EPCLVYRPYREQTLSNAELEIALAAIRRTVDGIDARFTIQTFFGDATTILPHLLKLPVDGIGFDLFETDHTRTKIETKKTLALGIVDSRESTIEDPKWIAETATRVSTHILSDNLDPVPSSDLQLVPRTCKTASIHREPEGSHPRTTGTLNNLRAAPLRTDGTRQRGRWGRAAKGGDV